MERLTQNQLDKLRDSQRRVKEENARKEVEYRNRVNAKTEQVQIDLISLFRPFVGKKVRTISGYGDWSAAVKKVLDPYLDTVRADGFRIMARYSCGSLGFEIDTTYKYQEVNYKGWESDHCCYVKNDFYIGRWDEETGNLREVSQDDIERGRRKDWTVEELREIRTRIKTLEQTLFTLKSSISEFR